MGMIKGKKVKLLEKVQNGMDDFNSPVFEENEVEVENVLIEPASNDAIVSEIQLTGKRVSYILHIPKGDTHNWKDAEVEFYGMRWKTFGDCLIYDIENTPGDWNKKIKVEAYE